jgi:ribonuclease HI
MTHATVWFDGASSGNPGPMKAGAVVEVEGLRQAFSKRYGRGTGNQAEYHALALGLQKALLLGATTVTVRGDSQLIVNQVQGRAQVRHPHLVGPHRQAVLLLAQFDSSQLEWVPREQNLDAHEAAARAAA